MKKILIIVGAILAVLAAAMWFLMPRGPDPALYAHLTTPRISMKPSQKVIVVEAAGDPNVVGAKAFGLLFKAYFKTKGVPKGPKQPAPCARWPVALETPKEQWIGRYAMPVPESITALPALEVDSGLTIALETWEYGEVAEILHVGPYTAEEPTVNRLLEFIDLEGYEVAGEHEEEYLKGPGMFGRGNPQKYLTIIRYRVKRKNPEEKKEPALSSAIA